MSQPTRYVPTRREQAFLDRVENPRYDREIINGLKPFIEERGPEDMRGFYSSDEIAELVSLRGTERDVETRMPVKMTRHYFEMAKRSVPLQRLVKASPDETLSLAGSEDPGYQMDFSPVEGLLPPGPLRPGTTGPGGALLRQPPRDALRPEAARPALRLRRRGPGGGRGGGAADPTPVHP